MSGRTFLLEYFGPRLFDGLFGTKLPRPCCFDGDGLFLVFADEIGKTIGKGRQGSVGRGGGGRGGGGGGSSGTEHRWGGGGVWLAKEAVEWFKELGQVWVMVGGEGSHSVRSGS